MIILGILLAISAAALGTLSKQLIAFSSRGRREWAFHLGAGLNIFVGPVVDAAAYAFAPQVIVAPFACLDVIFNALTAPCTLSWQKEQLSWRHAVGILLVTCGAVATSVFAAADDRVLSVHELEAKLIGRKASLGFFGAELVGVASAVMALRSSRLGHAARGLLLGGVAGLLMGNVFFAKGLLGIIRATATSGSWEAWWRPTPYLLAIAAATGAVCGHKFMRRGLSEYKGVFMVTIFEGAHITAACLSGCIVMEEMAGAPWWRYVLYWLGVLLILSGMLVINAASAESQLSEGSPESLAAAPHDLGSKEAPPTQLRYRFGAGRCRKWVWSSVTRRPTRPWLARSCALGGAVLVGRGLLAERLRPESHCWPSQLWRSGTTFPPLAFAVCGTPSRSRVDRTQTRASVTRCTLSILCSKQR